MEVFCIFYGLIEFSNSIYVYKDGKNNFNLFVTCIWGLSFTIVGLVELLNLSILMDFSYILFGLCWFPMAFTPCGIKIFRINKFTMLLRKIVFFIIGISQFIIVFF